MVIEKNLKLFGFDNYFDDFSNLYKSKKLPNKILISGKKGIGKTTFSYHLINFILSSNEEFTYDYNEKEINLLNKSYKLIHNRTHPNFFRISINEEKKFIEINQIREMINFINKSTFKNNIKLILIENVELLNQFSANGLLKSLEEPNSNVVFILLLNNENKCLETIKSRCIEYKINLKRKFLSEIVNFYFKDDVFDKISRDFINFYISPSELIKFIIFCNSEKLNYKDLSIDEFLKYYFENSIYKKNNIINDDIKLYLQLFFFNKINSIKNNDFIDLYNYFNQKFNFINKFNLDKESFFIEFNNKVFK
tara:strand:+ start:1097 stop:2023 length:927 start_codon:yes stop_codon:yes gene_type:complete